MPLDAGDLHAEADREFGPCTEHAAELRDDTVYPDGLRPVVLVDVDDVWLPGVLCRWQFSPAGERWAVATWHQLVDGDQRAFHATVPAERIRVDGADA